MKTFFSNFKGDRVIWVVMLILLIFSILAVYSSTRSLAYKLQEGNTTYYLIKQLLFLLFGVALTYITHLIKYTYYSRISQIGLIITIPLLIITLTSSSINEASRWIMLPGTGLTFQSSDLAKLVLIMYLARLLSIKQGNITDFKEAFLPVMLPILMVCGLILPANFSTAAILFVTSLVLMFVGRINIKYILSLVGIGIVAFSVMVVVLLNSDSQGRLGTWKKRIERYVGNNETVKADIKTTETDDANYQVEQGKIAIATGGLFGKLPGNSTQRNYLPHPYSDFIYAIIIEEYGLAGGFIVMFMYLVFFFRAIRIATKTERTFGMFLAIGCAFGLVFQAMINMAVAASLLPVTGQPLPLVSMGGTSILFTCITVGIILSVSRDIEENPQSQENIAYAAEQE